MKIHRLSAVGGAVAVLACTVAASASAAGPAVTVRVEGAKKTLLPATVVHGESGSITKGGTPAGACPGSTAAGDLDAATHHHWGGKYSSGLGIEVLTILGETHTFSSPAFWGVWVNGKLAGAGACGLRLKAGDQLLFAPSPVSGAAVFPIVLKAPAHATKGKPFTVKATYFNAHGKSTPLSGLKIAGAGTTNAKGVVTATAAKAGKLKLATSRKGFVRAEATVAVAP